MQLTDSMHTFIAHFGEMGSRWGINRTVGQMYALLYLSPKPLCADDISQTLSFSRSNVSMGLKELDGWRLIRIKHYPKDRKEYYTVPEDVWDIVRTLVDERKKREVDPTLSMLRNLLLKDGVTDNHPHVQSQMQQMHELIDQITHWYAEMAELETERLTALLSLGSKVYKLYEMKDKLKVLPGGKKEKDSL